MPGLTQEQQIQMAVDVGVVRTLVETHDGRLKSVEDSVKTLNEKLDGHVEWRQSVNSQLDSLKTGVDECKASGGIAGFMKSLDKKTIVIVVGLIIAAITAGGAGSDAVINLVKLVLGTN